MSPAQITAVLAVVFPVCAMSQPAELPEVRLPSGDEVGRALATLCSAEAHGATLGFAARESGQSLESVLARMPEPSDPGLKSIYRGFRQTGQDVYQHRSIGYAAMFDYRAKACFRERTELKRMPDVVFSAAGLLRCERDYGRENSAQLLTCVGKVVDAL